VDEYLTPQEAADLIPGMTKGTLAQLRFRSLGPTYLKPTPRKVIYRQSDIEAWLDASVRTGTRQAS
jgi:hypothetical protein